ncbi:MAG: TonB family protein [Stigonema ocellatum SAG 48.90 = DSM 106950]|nr:TonB family protein [Stigonema ocellatum SAG 48.90 = DSM 106950]
MAKPDKLQINRSDRPEDLLLGVVTSILLHSILFVIGNYWLRSVALKQKQNLSEPIPIEYVQVPPNKTKAPPKTSRRATKDSVAGGKAKRERPVSTAKSGSSVTPKVSASSPKDLTVPEPAEAFLPELTQPTAGSPNLSLQKSPPKPPKTAVAPATIPPAPQPPKTVVAPAAIPPAPKPPQTALPPVATPLAPQPPETAVAPVTTPPAPKHRKIAVAAATIPAPKPPQTALPPVTTPPAPQPPETAVAPVTTPPAPKPRKIAVTPAAIPPALPPVTTPPTPQPHKIAVTPVTTPPAPKPHKIAVTPATIPPALPPVTTPPTPQPHKIAVTPVTTPPAIKPRKIAVTPAATPPAPKPRKIAVTPAATPPAIKPRKIAIAPAATTSAPLTRQEHKNRLTPKSTSGQLATRATPRTQSQVQPSGKSGGASSLGGPISLSSRNFEGNYLAAMPNSNRVNRSVEGIDARQDTDPLAAYLEELQQKVRRQWIPELTQSSRQTVLHFTIQRSGQIVNLQVAQPSGNSVTDEAAFNAVKRAAPFAPLPTRYTENYINIQFTFTISVYGQLDIEGGSY